MYKIRGEDGKEFGPVIPAVVRQWISHGKAGADSLVQRVGESEWKPLSSVPEFAADLGLPVEAQASGPAQTAPQGELCGMAVASFVVGLLGFFIVPAVVGMTLGVIAQTRISGSGSRLRGSGWAVAGMVASGLTLILGLPFWGATLLPPMARAQAEQRDEQCLANLERLSRAIRSYQNRHEGALPPTATWCDALQSPDLRDAFECPSQPRLKSGYAMNALLAAHSASNIPPNTVLLFESNKGWNATGSAEDMITTRHPRGVNIGFANGDVERIPAWQIPQLKWIP